MSRAKELSPYQRAALRSVADAISAYHAKVSEIEQDEKAEDPVPPARPKRPKFDELMRLKMPGGRPVGAGVAEGCAGSGQSKRQGWGVAPAEGLPELEPEANRSGTAGRGCLGERASAMMPSGRARDKAARRALVDKAIFLASRYRFAIFRIVFQYENSHHRVPMA
jgi:hypothetical protein